MRVVEQLKGVGSSSSNPGRRPGRVPVSEETKARIAATLLWLLVIVAALGAAGSFLASSPAPVVQEQVVEGGAPPWESAVAMATGERFVEAYIAGGPDAEGRLAGFLGDVPDLPAGSDDSDAVGEWLARAVDAVLLADGGGYWAVTVAVTRSGVDEAFWRVGVAFDDAGVPRVAALPTPVTGPRSSAAPVELATPLGAVPTSGEDEPRVEVVEGFVAAYACGDGDLDRWLAPDATVERLDPPLCQSTALARWGEAPAGDAAAGRTVTVEVLLEDADGGPGSLVAFSLGLMERDGRWEVAELLAAPPLKSSVEGMDEEVLR